jgi:2-(1,2-epoxy-1,2-dihydrophenyl)acetyl-CoA isomerase
VADASRGGSIDGGHVTIGDALTLEIQDDIATITFARPDTGDPIDAIFCRELLDVVNILADHDALRVVQIRSAGRFFSVGGDVKSFLAEGDALPAYIRSATGDVGPAMSRLASLPVPVVVEVKGPAVGGSLSIVAVADVTIAGSNASFFAAFTGIGLSPDMGNTYFVTRRVGSRQASNFYMLNQTWTADDALAHGLVSFVVPDDELRDRTAQIVGDLATKATAALGATKRLMWRTWDNTLDAQLELEAASITRLAATEDAREGLTAVSERRPAKFHGR